MTRTEGQGPGAYSLASLRASPDCVLLLNREGRVSFLNDGARRFVEHERAAGVEWWDLWPPDVRGQVREEFRRALQGGTIRFRSARPGPDGAVVDWDVTVTPMIDGEGAVENVLVMVRDAAAGAAGG